MAIVPVVRAVGANATGTTGASPGLPAGTVAGDLLICVVASAGAAAEPTMTGWNKIRTVKNGTALTDSMLTVFWKIAVGGDATAIAGTTNHVSARIIGFQAGTFNSTTPIHGESGGNVQASTTSVSITGLTTSVADCYILAMSGASLPDANSTTQYDSWANANLTGGQELTDDNTNQGNGGGHGTWGGVKSTAGATGATTATKAAAALLANLTIAIAPGAEVTVPTLANTFEGGTHGVAVSLANSGGASGNAFDELYVAAGPDIFYDTSAAAHGSLGAKFDTGAGGGVRRLGWNATSIGGPFTQVFGRRYFILPALPANWHGLVSVLNATDWRFVVGVRADGFLSCREPNGWTNGTNAIVPSTLYRVEFRAIYGSPTTLTARLYTGDSTTLIEEVTRTWSTNPDAFANRVYFGALTGEDGLNFVSYGDSFQINGTDWPGPLAPPPSADVLIPYVGGGYYL